ncbi:hypothetical protein OGATHE_004544 [Ogataea polymorpha]|uniref:Uncharacterized protein n=1 Tax=Ogataea polymorpha TaxID=460523 RepID=A0A9P8NZV1_9ASCO|nr:hypothetical protein OGATHE_004544 [Ogataea polymorpha]
MGGSPASARQDSAGAFFVVQPFDGNNAPATVAGSKCSEYAGEDRKGDPAAAPELPHCPNFILLICSSSSGEIGICSSTRTSFKSGTSSASGSGRALPTGELDTWLFSGTSEYSSTGASFETESDANSSRFS